MTMPALTTALQLSRDMLDCADSRDWAAIAELQQQRLNLLSDLPAEATDSEDWHALAELNQQLVAKLRTLQDENVSETAKQQRQSKAASNYRLA